MNDIELIATAKETSKILREADIGMDDVVSVIELLVLRVKELNDKANKISEYKNDIH